MLRSNILLISLLLPLWADEFTPSASTDTAHTQCTVNTFYGYPPDGPGGDGFPSCSADSGGSSNFVSGSLSAPNYVYRPVFVRFDTSSIPDAATVTAVSLKIDVTSIADNDSFTLRVGYASSGAWPITTSDYTTSPATNAHSGTALGSLVDDAVNTLALTNLTNISKTGYTALVLSLPPSSTPSGLNSVVFSLPLILDVTYEGISHPFVVIVTGD